MEKTLQLILAEQKRQSDLLHQLIDTVATTNVKIAELDGNIADLQGRVTGVESKISEMDGKISKMDGRIIGVEAKISEMDGKISIINGKVDTIETKLDSVYEEVKEIKEKMATKHDLEYYDQMISEHSREIYKLKNH